MILQQARGQINDIQQRKEGKGRKLESVIRSAETSVCDGESQEWQSQVGRVKMSSQNLMNSSSFMLQDPVEKNDI